jgi:hypothetical protein
MFLALHSPDRDGEGLVLLGLELELVGKGPDEVHRIGGFRTLPELIEGRGGWSGVSAYHSTEAVKFQVVYMVITIEKQKSERINI